jgi:DNA-binding response OmpR family regulator
MTRQPRVLLVEHDPFLRRASEASLRQSGYDVLTAGDGEAGLRLARATPPPDVILLDVLLPPLPAVDMLRRLEADPATARIPVLVLTSPSQDGALPEGPHAGACVVRSNLPLKDWAAQLERLVKEHREAVPGQGS